MALSATSRHRALLAAAVFLTANLAVTATARSPDLEPVSPGHESRSPEIGAPCPTFSWSTEGGDTPLELVVFRPAPEDEQPELLIQQKLAGGARTWTPELSHCLAWGEEYGWFLRRLGDEPGPWSEPRYFQLPDTPTEAQAERAANVLKRYLADRQGPGTSGDAFGGPAAIVGAAGGTGIDDDGKPDSTKPASPGNRDLPDLVELSGSVRALKRLASPKATSTAAMRGMQGDDTGEAYGLWGESPSPDGGGVFGRATATTGDAPGVAGTSDSASGAGVLGMAVATSGVNAGVRGTTSSADGAGVLAENAGGGPDLLLSGSPSAALTEAGVRVNSSNDQTFVLSNSGSGSMSLAVDGDPVQAEVIGTCPDHTRLAGVHPDGTVACERLAFGVDWVADDDGGNRLGTHTSIAVRNDGAPIISYLNATKETFSFTFADLKVFDCDDAACSSGTTRTIDDGGGDNVGFDTSIAVRNDGTPVISYHDDTNDNLKVFDCDDAACSSGTARTVHSTGDNVGSATSIAVRADGTPVISYYDNTNDNLKVFDCDNAACSSGIDHTADDGGGGNVGLHTSIAVRADGTPVISYYDLTNDNLKVFDCDDAACSSGIDRTADDGSGNDVGRSTSIAVRDNGTPVISYLDNTNGNLKIFDCDDAACSSGADYTVDDGSGDNVGSSTSIAVRDDGKPVISYRDGSNRNLKVFVIDSINRDLGFLNGTARTVHATRYDVGIDTSIAVRDDGTPLISYHDSTIGNLLLFSCGDPDCRR